MTYLLLLSKEDISTIKNLEERESIVDELRYSIFRECLTYMMEDNKNITQGAHLYDGFPIFGTMWRSCL